MSRKKNKLLKNQPNVTEVLWEILQHKTQTFIAQSQVLQNKKLNNLKSYDPHRAVVPHICVNNLLKINYSLSVRILVALLLILI